MAQSSIENCQAHWNLQAARISTRRRPEFRASMQRLLHPMTGPLCSFAHMLFPVITGALKGFQRPAVLDLLKGIDSLEAHVIIFIIQTFRDKFDG